MTVRVYSSLDTGAPVLSGNFYARLRTILKACLVDGYGSKPAAGWSIVHDLTNGFSLSNGDGVINFVYNGTYDVAVYIMEAVTDGTTALASGVNRRSASWYDGNSTTERNLIYGAQLSIGSNPHWVLVADEKTCIWMHSGGTSTADQTSSSGGATHYFGNYLNALGLTGPGLFCSLGGWPDASGNQRFAYADGRYGMMLRNPYTGLVEQGTTARYGASLPLHTRGGGLFYISSVPKTQMDRLYPVRAGLMCYGTGVNGSSSASSAGLAGYLRGVISEPMLATTKLSQVLTYLGLSNTWQARVQPITLPNSDVWVPMYPHETDAGLFVSLDPAYWG